MARTVDLVLTSPAPFEALAALQLGLVDRCISGLRDRARIGVGAEMPLAPLLHGFLAHTAKETIRGNDVDWVMLWHFRESGEDGSLTRLRSLSTELCALAGVPHGVASALAFGPRRLERAALQNALTRIESVTLVLAGLECVPERLRLLSAALKYAANAGGTAASTAAQIAPLLSRVGWNADACEVVDAVRGFGEVAPSAEQRFAARVGIASALMFA